MPARRVSGSDAPQRRRAPATTPEARENQIISDAMDLAEKQIRNGTASAQVISHFLKLGSSREKLEQERLRGEVSLIAAKQEMMETAKRIESMYSEALDAMRSYQGRPPREEEEGYDD
ncbi:MAG TPA: hypothetical protein VFP47_08180 [Pyrinomonadaceae bacterium]|nr:hypothetical protein [Pyrinomonadaceae bacterium]